MHAATSRSCPPAPLRGCGSRRCCSAGATCARCRVAPPCPCTPGRFRRSSTCRARAPRRVRHAASGRRMRAHRALLGSLRCPLRSSTIAASANRCRYRAVRRVSSTARRRLASCGTCPRAVVARPCSRSTACAAPAAHPRAAHPPRRCRAACSPARCRWLLTRRARRARASASRPAHSRGSHARVASPRASITTAAAVMPDRFACVPSAHMHGTGHFTGGNASCVASSARSRNGTSFRS